MNRPCFCNNTPKENEVYSTNYCRLCWLYQHSPTYRILWSDPKTQAKNQPCFHLGLDTGETLLCPSCQGAVKVKLFNCSLHQKCSLVKPVGETKCCKTCTDYKEVNNANPA